MSKLLLTLLLTLTGCINLDAPTPEERGIKVNRDIHKVYYQDKAMLHFEATVEDRFFVELGNRWEDTKVWWADTKCPYSDNYAVIHDGECFAGKMWTCHQMYVAVSGLDEKKTCGTALLHEFAHCLSMDIWGHGDGAHAGPIWELVADASRVACDRGW